LQILTCVKSPRAEAVRLLRLNSGNRVLDGGCGLGGSFPYLADAVGPSGEVVGVEISPSVAENPQISIRHVSGFGLNKID
jgi:cyclopropane fatty-acyl-phospholipid synthase-like methyltransferase